MKRPNDFTKLDPTGAARNGKTSNGLHNHLIVDGQCLLYGLHVANEGASTRFVMLFDSRELPGSGSKPIRQWELPATAALDHELVNGRPFNEGLCIALSSTRSYFTKITSDEALFDCTFTEL